jgi:type IV pilus assembly protein PilC
MKFKYQARTKDGQIQAGSVEANNREDALGLLHRYELYITSLEEDKEAIYSKEIRLFERIKGKDIVLFSRQLAIMFKSNVPIVEALHSLAQQTNKHVFRRVIMKISEKVEGGNSLSQALQNYPQHFSPFFIGVVKSGEVSGKLSDSLNYLADYLENNYRFNSKIISSMYYPIFVGVVFVGILVLLVTFVIPQLAEILVGMDEDLPAMTKMVLAFTDFFTKFWWIFALFCVVVPIIFARLIKTPSGKKHFDHFSVNIPFIGDFIKKINLVRLAENLSTLIASGLPIIQALEVSSDVVNNNIYKTILLEVKEGVRRGETISSVLNNHPKYFPPLFTQMTIVGERTGNLDSSLRNVIEFYRAEVENSLEGLTKLLEPIMIIMLGGVVGFLVVSILLPVYQISTSAGGI